MPVILGGNTGIYLASLAPSVDPDAQAFITAASITDPTQQAAINQLVVDLKGYSIWTKMKALYPFVGGTSTTHKYNLKDPRDLDVAFRLVFNGGWTHSSTGALPNGTNAYADTKLSPSLQLSANSAHLSYYSRTNSAFSGEIVMGILDGNTGASGLNLVVRRDTNLNSFRATETGGANGLVNSTSTDSRGFTSGSITSATSRKIYKNGTLLNTNTNNYTWNRANFNIPIGSAYDSHYVTYNSYTNKECAFASIGNGLTDTEAANFYTAVQAFQTTLGRSIGTQTVSDADAQAFVTNAGIVDQVEANAINNLVIGLKADSLWSKMKAIYPFVGGTATTHKYNLKNPLDTDAAFRLVFNGGITHSSNGIVGNATNGYADTKLTPLSTLSLNSTHISYYSRTDTGTFNCVEMGVNDGANTGRLFIAPKYSGASYRAVNSAQAGAGAGTAMQGLFIASRVNSTAMKLYKNSSVLFNDTVSSGSLFNVPIFLFCYNSGGFPQFYSDRQCAFASIGDGLDDTEATNLTNRVQTFNTALARQV